MAVIKDAAKRMPGDISLVTVIDGIVLYQDGAGTYCKPSMLSVTSRTDADDLIIALMLARDTLWPNEPSKE